MPTKVIVGSSNYVLPLRFLDGCDRSYDRTGDTGDINGFGKGCVGDYDAHFSPPVEGPNGYYRQITFITILLIIIIGTSRKNNIYLYLCTEPYR